MNGTVCKEDKSRAQSNSHMLVVTHCKRFCSSPGIPNTWESSYISNHGDWLWRQGGVRLNAEAGKIDSVKNSFVCPESNFFNKSARRLWVRVILGWLLWREGFAEEKTIQTYTSTPHLWTNSFPSALKAELVSAEKYQRQTETLTKLFNCMLTRCETKRWQREVSHATSLKFWSISSCLEKEKSPSLLLFGNRVDLALWREGPLGQFRAQEKPSAARYLEGSGGGAALRAGLAGGHTALHPVPSRPAAGGVTPDGSRATRAPARPSAGVSAPVPRRDSPSWSCSHRPPGFLPIRHRRMAPGLTTEVLAGQLARGAPATSLRGRDGSMRGRGRPGREKARRAERVPVGAGDSPSLFAVAVEENRVPEEGPIVPPEEQRVLGVQVVGPRHRQALP